MNIPKDILNKIGEIQAITDPEEQGCTSQVAFIKTSERTYALKTSKDPLFRTWLKNESYILEHLKDLNLPTPKPFLFIEKDYASWLLMEKLPGRTLASALSEEKDEQRRAKLISEFGAVVAQVHSAPAPAALRTATQPWLESMLAEAQYNLEHHEVDGSQQLLNQLKATPPTPIEPTLIHGDLTVDNVLTDGRQITGH
ncbi:phosphotransferase [Filobacillus milosensis]|nr:phosphotransferase [Filobacillus milosensis]